MITDYYWFGPNHKENVMSDIIGRVGHVRVEKYSVLQVSDDGCKTWLDFCTLREPSEVEIAVRMVNNRGGINGHRTADYRIMCGGKGTILYDRRTSVVADDIMFDIGDILQVHRFDDSDDLAAGWVESLTISCPREAKIAAERMHRLRQSEDTRHYRVMTKDGHVRASQDTYNSLRLSGILWQADPLGFSATQDVHSDTYDRYAARIMECGTDWDKQILPILQGLRADEKLTDQVYSFLALT